MSPEASPPAAFEGRMERRTGVLQKNVVPRFKQASTSAEYFTPTRWFLSVRKSTHTQILSKSSKTLLPVCQKLPSSFGGQKYKGNKGVAAEKEPLAPLVFRERLRLGGDGHLHPGHELEDALGRHLPHLRVARAPGGEGAQVSARHVSDERTAGGFREEVGRRVGLERSFLVEHLCHAGGALAEGGSRQATDVHVDRRHRRAPVTNGARGQGVGGGGGGSSARQF